MWLQTTTAHDPGAGGAQHRHDHDRDHVSRLDNPHGAEYPGVFQRVFERTLPELI